MKFFGQLFSPSSKAAAKKFVDSGLHKGIEGDNQGAIEDYTKAIELNRYYPIEFMPYYPYAYVRRGNVHYVLKEYQKAIADYTKAIKLKSDYAEAYEKRGIVYYELKGYQEAIANYTMAINLNPDDFAAPYYNRGLIYEIQGENQTAIKDFQKAAELYQQQGNTEWYQNAINKIKELER